MPLAGVTVTSDRVMLLSMLFREGPFAQGSLQVLAADDPECL